MSKKKKVTALDVARAAGVSQATVSMVLNNSDYASFSEETRQKVYQACIATGYRSIAPAKAKGNLKTILTACPSCGNADYMAEVESIQKACLNHGYNSLTLFTLRNPEIEKNILQTVSAQAIDGVIFLYKPENPWIISNIESLVPTISVCDHDPLIVFDSIEINSEKIGAIIAQHLIDFGHERIAYIATELNKKYSLRVNRLNGIKNTYHSNGYDPEESIVVCTFETEGLLLGDSTTDYEAGFILANQVIEKYNVTAIVGNNDQVCFGIIDAIQRKKKRIPQDYSVCGCDNIPLSNIKSLSLTTIDNYTNLRATEAVNLLIRKIKNLSKSAKEQSPISTVKVEYTPKLVLRSSTGPARKI